MKTIRIFIIIFSAMIIIVFGFVIYWLFQFANTTECNEISIYKSNNYNILEETCLGWAGPSWKTYTLKFNENLIVTDSVRTDSCKINFHTSSVQYSFDKCTEEFKIHKL